MHNAHTKVHKIQPGKSGSADTKLVKTLVKRFFSCLPVQFHKLDLNYSTYFQGSPPFLGRNRSLCAKKACPRNSWFFFAARQQKHLFWNPLQSAQSCHLPRSKFHENFVVQLQNRGSCQNGDTIFCSFCCYRTLVVP